MGESRAWHTRSVMQAPLPRAWDAIQVSGCSSLSEPRFFERLLNSKAPTIVFCSGLPEVRRRSTAYIVIDAGFDVQNGVYLTVRTRRDGRTPVFRIKGGLQLNTSPASPVLYTVENRIGQGIMRERCPFTLKILRPGGSNYAPTITVTIDIGVHPAIDIPSHDSDGD